MAEGRMTGGPDLSGLRIDEGARASSTKARWAIVAGALGLLVVAAVTAIVLFGGRPVEVGVAAARAVSAGERPALLNASGYVTPRRRATVAAKITARVVEMLADEGMVVRAGQVLARLDDSDAQKRLAIAQTALGVARAGVPVLEVNLVNAERELKRQEDLAKDGVNTVQELDQARTTRDGLKAQLVAAEQQVGEARASLASAQQDVDNCTVRAPFAGVVVSKDAQPGEMVSPVSAGSGFTRTGIATVVDMDSLEVEVDVNEAYIAKVQPGQRVDATLDAYPDWHLPASVRTVIPTADRQKATVKVRISFDKLDPRILPDMGVKVTFLGEAESASGRAPRVLVPKVAVRQDEGKTVVFVVRDGRLERRAVRTGGEDGGDIEVLAGVSEGEPVVVEGPGGLHEGERVRIRRE